MTKLIKKEFALAMHPVTPLMVLLGAMVLIPAYPYAVMFFYVAMSVFFTCLSGRENKDIAYSLALPVAKKDIVAARVAYAAIIQLMQLAVALPFVLVKNSLFPTPNPAGIDAGISVFAVGFIAFGLFNAVFFTSYYKDTEKVGMAFVKASIALGIYAAFDLVATYAIPFVKNILDSPDPNHIAEKLVFLLCACAFYCLATFFTCKTAQKSFSVQDIRL